MNARVLELLKQPETISPEDLKVLEKDIRNYPYAQSFRALQLLGISKFDENNHKKQLSVTAAYTTDKKILYQFVNKEQIFISNLEPETEQIHSKEDEKSHEEVLSKPDENEIENIQVENSLISDNENITYTKNKEAEVVLNEEQPALIEEKTVGIVPQDQIQQKEVKPKETSTEDLSQLSFQGTEGFMTNVKISSNTSENYIPKPQMSKHEEEMQKLIAEVEAKMKAKKQQNEAAKPVTETIIEPENVTDEVQDSTPIETKEIEKTEIPQNAAWKPMSFSTNITGALVSGEKEEMKTDISIDKIEDTKNIEETAEEKNTTEDRPTLNVSFFSQNLEQFPEENKEEEKRPEIEKDENSNIPKFLNTWQSWLKLSKPEQEPEKHEAEAKLEETEIVKEPEIEEIHQKEEEKAQIIDKFIEEQPKISKLKEENNFTVKEKTDDISHLMTETLAHLYVEQRLYAKAIKAFEILKEKHPEKSEYFNEKINEVKELRTKG